MFNGFRLLLILMLLPAVLTIGLAQPDDGCPTGGTAATPAPDNFQIRLNLAASINLNANTIAYVRSYPTDPCIFRQSIYTYDIETGEDRFWFETYTASTTYHGLSFSPDGTALAFSARYPGRSEDIYQMDIAGGTIRNLTPDDASIDIQPVWSPDGSQIAYLTAGPQGYAVTLLDVESGEKRVIVPGESSFHPVTWSPDGQSFIYSGRPDDDPDPFNFELFRVTVADGERERLTDNDLTEGTPTLSPDGTALVFDRGQADDGERNLYRLDLEADDLEALTDENSLLTDPVWSADGTRLAYLRWDDWITIYLLDTTGDVDPILLIESSDSEAFDAVSPAWYPAEYSPAQV